MAVFLHVTFLSHAGALWRDEVNGVTTATAPTLADVWRLAEFSSYPLLYTFVLRAWTSIGAFGTDAGLRALGMLGGLTLPAAVWFAARRLGRGVPLVGVALIAVNPEVIRWSASVHAWGLGTSLVVVAGVLVWQASGTPTRRNLLLAGVASIACVQCLYQNAVLLAAILSVGLAVVLRAARPRPRPRGSCPWRRSGRGLFTDAVRAAHHAPQPMDGTRRRIHYLAGAGAASVDRDYLVWFSRPFRLGLPRATRGLVGRSAAEP
jgi:hypothetical protein